MMIKAIALDLVGVYLREKSIELTATEKEIESNFGLHGKDSQFIQYISKHTGKTPEEAAAATRQLIERLYEIREPDLFSKLPTLSFAIATSHQTYILDWLKTKPETLAFNYAISTGETGLTKADPLFFRTLSERICVEPNEVLFIDDHLDNCRVAQSIGMRVHYFQPGEVLSDVILSALSGKSGRPKL